VVVLDSRELLLYVTVPVIVTLSVGLTEGPGAAETVGESLIVTVSVLEIRPVPETQDVVVDDLLIGSVIVKVGVED
jgi:hypothetical protein